VRILGDVIASQRASTIEAVMAPGGLLDMFWAERRADEFDQGCMRG
jgi:hypothetical protein